MPKVHSRKEWLHQNLKRINNEQILDTIYDLADGLGLRIDQFLERVEEEFGEQPINTDGLPEEVVNALDEARENKKSQRRQARAQKSSEEMSAEIKKFREIFPDVSADDIPETVWEDVQNGETLSYAYAYHLATSDALNRYADGINQRNSNAGAYASSDGATEPVYTKEQVEKMSGKEIKNNYKNILSAMKNWKFN